MSYMRSLSPKQREERFSELCRRNLPMLVVSRGASLEPRLVDIANEAGIGVFRTPMISMQFINEATLALEWQFAPTASMHGCMVDVQGIGVMILGKSGTGKSETVVGLLDRGASLVADDLVRLRAVGGEVIGRSPELGRAHMEVRGLGLINVAAIFGIAKIRMEKRLDFIVRMTPQHEMKEIERLGVKGSVLRVLGQDIPYVELPVAPGRDMARMVEVAALDQKLRGMGYDTAEEFNRRLIELMDSQTDQRNR
jgi:HPr kinase/phosphorylase